MDKRIVSPTGKSKPLAPVRPSAAIEAAYRRKLDALIREMSESLVYWVKAAYRKTPPIMAQDASPAQVIERAMRRLTRRWQRRFDDIAPEMATWFATAAAMRSDAAMKAILKRGGMTVAFQWTPATKDAFHATVAENVGLIKSIAAEHLSAVQGDVMRSVAAGRDLGTMAKTIEARYGITKKRAAFISRDQNNKATAVITRARQVELGITQARWLHSAGGRVPRPSHVKASRDGLIYDVAKGALIDGEYIFPGQLPNCRCVSVPIVAGFT